MNAPLRLLSPSLVTGMHCVICGRHFDPDYLDKAYVCPDHPEFPHEGILDIHYNYKSAAEAFPDYSQPGLWRYRSILPLPLNAETPPLQTGLTPLYDAPRLAKKLGLRQLWIKDESRQPTASFKDRASCLAVALAKLRQATVVATASTGNAAAALAGMSAAMGQTCAIFVPAAAPKAKIAQLLAYGAHIFLVNGSYDQAFELCMEACARMGWYNRNTGYNPNMAEGKKSAALEIGEQLGWQVPDAVFVGVGDGCIMAGLYKGFADLVRLGRADRMPRLYGVQAEGSDFLCQAWEEGRFSPEALLAKAPVQPSTLADSISAGLPRDRIKAMHAVRSTGGRFVRVADQDILAAIPALATHSGVFAEPAAAAPLAGLEQALRDGLVASTESVCLMVTGSGLKDTAALSQLDANSVRPQPIFLDPNPASLNNALKLLSF